jgi:hypothetical protein
MEVVQTVGDNHPVVSGGGSREAMVVQYQGKGNPRRRALMWKQVMK